MTNTQRTLCCISLFCSITLPLVAQPELIVAAPNPPPLAAEQPSTSIEVSNGVQEALAESSTSFNSYGAVGSVTTVKVDGQQTPDITLAGVSLESPQSGSVNLNEIPAALFPQAVITTSGALSFGAADTYVPYVRLRNVSYTPGISERTGQNRYEFRSLVDTQQIDALITGSAGALALTAAADVLYAANNFMFINSSNGRRYREEHAPAFIGKSGILARYGNRTSQDGAYGETALLFSGDYLSVSGGESSVTAGTQTDVTSRLISSGAMPFSKQLRAGYNANVLFTRMTYQSGSEDSSHTIFACGAGFPITWKIPNSNGTQNNTDFTVTAEPRYAIQFLNTTDATQSVIRHLPGITIGATLPFNTWNATATVRTLFPELAHVDSDIQLEVAVAPLSTLCIFAGGAWIYKQPTLNQLYYNTGFAHGNKNLNPESCVKGWLGIKVRRPYCDVTVKPFVSLYQEKISWGSVGGMLTPINNGSAVYMGCTVSLKTPDIHGWQGDASYTLSPSFLLTDGLTIQDNRRVMYSPIHTAAAKVTYHNGDWLFAIKGRYSSERYESNANISLLNAYFLLGVSTDWTHNRVTVHLGADNLLNVTYYEVSSYPMPGINATLSVKITL